MENIKFLKELLEKNGITVDEEIFNAIKGAIEEKYVSRKEHEGMLMDGQLKNALIKSGARSEKAILGFIDKSLLALENGELKGFDKQIAEIKKEHGYLFNEAQSTGFNHQSGMSIDYDSLSDEEYYKLKTERN